METTKQERNHFKIAFIEYFEGGDWAELVEYCNITKFGISLIEFTKVNNTITVSMFIARPGLLIGKSGRTIDGVTNYINCCQIDTDVIYKIELKEFDPFKLEH